MTPSALQAIATLTGEPVHPCKRDGIVYAVSKSWTVWYHKDDWHAVDRQCLIHERTPILGNAVQTMYANPLMRSWADYPLNGELSLDALRQYANTCGYTTTDLAVRMGYSPGNKDVCRYLSGNKPVTKEFAQRAVAAFGRGVLGGQS